MTQETPKKWILAIDPGSDKAGFAVVYKEDMSHGEMGVCYISELHRVFKRLCSGKNLPEAVVLGNGTAAAVVCRLYNSLELAPALRLAEEKNTTWKARARYFTENPPRGLWRLVPIGLQVPPRPIDDYAAWLIGEAYLKDLPLT